MKEQYESIQQMQKKVGGQQERKPIYPATVIQAIFDAKTGASLEAILTQFNSVYVQYQGSPKATRNSIPVEMRRAGLSITYMTIEGDTITERASSAAQKESDNWGLDINWSRIDELSLSGEISVSVSGTWIINGQDTGIKAVGPKGDAGITPWLKTIDNRLHVSYDNVTWEPCSEYLAAYFRFTSTGGSNTIGKIQISRDGETWNDLSPEFTNSLHIAGYVATTSALPSGQPVGTIFGVGPTYATEDTAHTNPIYRLYVYDGSKWVDNGAFTSIAAGVTQETGDNENLVMSQKAVTEKLSELALEVDTLSFIKGEQLEYVKKENAVINKSGAIEAQSTNSRFARFYNVSSEANILFSRAGVGYSTDYAFYSSDSVFDSTTLIAKGTYYEGVAVNYTDKLLEVPVGAIYFVAVGNNDDKSNFACKSKSTKLVVEESSKAANQIGNKINNDKDSVKYYNIDGKFTKEEMVPDAEVVSGRYAYTNSSALGWATAGNASNEYVTIDISELETINIDAAAWNSSAKTIILVDESNTKLANFGYDSTNATFMTFVTKGDVYSFDIQKLLEYKPNCKKLIFNFLIGSFGAEKIKCIIGKKSLNWLSLKDNDDFKELKLGSIKSYFLEEAKLTADTIIEKAAGKSVIVNIVTDTHERYWESGDVKCYDETFDNIKYVNSMVESNLLVHLGDVLMSGQTSSGKYDDNEIVKAHLGKFFDRMRQSHKKSAILLGNHDGIYGGMPDAKAIYPSMGVYSAGVRYKNRPFFYSTDSEKLVRCVFLCCPYSWDGKSDWAFGEEQLNWLITEALNVGNNYHVIFFTHTPLYGNDMVNSDYKDIEGVINAFNNHTSFTTSYNQVADFTEKSGTKSVALICGHEHCDLVVRDNSYFTRYNLCCPIVLVANNYRYGGTGSIPNAVYYNESQRKNGTVNQDLWDTLVYRKDLAKLYMIRFGAGEDREIDV